MFATLQSSLTSGDSLKSILRQVMLYKNLCICAERQLLGMKEIKTLKIHPEEELGAAKVELQFLPFRFSHPDSDPRVNLFWELSCFVKPLKRNIINTFHFIFPTNDSLTFFGEKLENYTIPKYNFWQERLAKFFIVVLHNFYNLTLCHRWQKKIYGNYFAK